MAASKKAVPPIAVRPAAAKIEEPNAEVKKAETPATSVKTESVTVASEEITKESAKETAQVPEKKTRGRKPGAKKEPAKTAAKKAELKSEICIQFSGKSYTQEELIKIARDVWKYDLKQKVRSLESVELYVKPEENTVYYVMNKEFTGSFAI